MEFFLRIFSGSDLFFNYFTTVLELQRLYGIEWDVKINMKGEKKDF
jgi:hypothetical protein